MEGPTDPVLRLFGVIRIDDRLADVEFVGGIDDAFSEGQSGSKRHRTHGPRHDLSDGVREKLHRVTGRRPEEDRVAEHHAVQDDFALIRPSLDTEQRVRTELRYQI